MLFLTEYFTMLFFTTSYEPESSTNRSSNICEVQLRSMLVVGLYKLLSSIWAHFFGLICISIILSCTKTWKSGFFFIHFLHVLLNYAFMRKFYSSLLVCIGQKCFIGSTATFCIRTTNSTMRMCILVSFYCCLKIY